MYMKRRFTTIIYNYNYIYSSKVFHTRSKARKATDYPTTRLPSKRFQASDSTFQAKRRMVSKKTPGSLDNAFLRRYLCTCQPEDKTTTHNS